MRNFARKHSRIMVKTTTIVLKSLILFF